MNDKPARPFPGRVLQRTRVSLSGRSDAPHVAERGEMSALISHERTKQNRQSWHYSTSGINLNEALRVSYRRHTSGK